MLNVSDIRKNVKVKVCNNPSIRDHVYVIESVEITERSMYLNLVREDDESIKRDEKAEYCELA